MENTIKIKLNKSFADFNMAILTEWDDSNPGSVLSSYSLFKAVSNNQNMPFLLNIAPFYTNKKDKTNEFLAEHCQVRFLNDYNSLYSLNDYINKFIVSLDIVAASNLIDETLKDIIYLNFVGNKKLKLAYACSFTMNLSLGNGISDSKHLGLEKYEFLNRFSNISTKDRLDQVQMLDTFGTYPQLVLDPLFLIHPIEYINLFNLNQESTSKIFVHLSKKYQNILPYFKDSFDIISYINSNSCTSKDIKFYLSTIVNSRFIISDCYHTICLAILLEKQFIALSINHSKHLDSLLYSMNLADRLVPFEEMPYKKYLLHKKIDYQEANNIFNLSRNSSEWLRKNLCEE